MTGKKVQSAHGWDIGYKVEHCSAFLNDAIYEVVKIISYPEKGSHDTGDYIPAYARIYARRVLKNGKLGKSYIVMPTLPGQDRWKLHKMRGGVM